MIAVLKPEFVEFIPEKLEPGKLYISREYATAQHLCCCGCGYRVVTPLSPTYWQMTVDGEFVSLYPSIGNSGFSCRSHYWIKRNQVVQSYPMSQRDIEAGRRYDAKLKERHFSGKPGAKDEPLPPAKPEPIHSPTSETAWQRFIKWLFG